MKKLLLGVLCAATVVAALPVQARDHGRWEHGRGGYGHRFEHHEAHHGGSRWIAPLAVAALVGGAIYASNPSYVSQPVVVAPPVVVNPPRLAYFCQPYQQYYPAVATCPTPWQAVPY